MGDMKTGSLGKNASEVKTLDTKPEKGKDAPSADEAVEDQSVTVEGPSEALSADKELEGKNA